MSRMKATAKMKKRTPKPLYITKAERALRRAGRKVRIESSRLGLTLVVWESGKTKKAKI